MGRISIWSQKQQFLLIAINVISLFCLPKVEFVARAASFIAVLIFPYGIFPIRGNYSKSVIQSAKIVERKKRPGI